MVFQLVFPLSVCEWQSTIIYVRVCYLIIHSLQETFSAKSLSKPGIDHLDEEHMLGATCTTFDSEISDRLVL
jgi:hypothetical protein